MIVNALDICTTQQYGENILKKHAIHYQLSRMCCSPKKANELLKAAVTPHPSEGATKPPTFLSYQICLTYILMLSLTFSTQATIYLSSELKYGQ